MVKKVVIQFSYCLSWVAISKIVLTKYELCHIRGVLVVPFFLLWLKDLLKLVFTI